MKTSFTLRLLSTVFIVSFFLGSCSHKPDGNLVTAGSPMAESIRFGYALYMLPVHTKDPAVILHDVLARKYPSLKLVSEIPTQPDQMVVSAHIQNNVQKEFAPPKLGLLKFKGHGLSPQQEQELQKSKEAFVFEFAHPKENVWTGLRVANELVEDIARNTGGLVWDEDTREVFSPNAWHERRLASWPEGTPDISSQTVVEVYKNNDFNRAITLGMAKAGLPDVIVDNFSSFSDNQVVDLINIFSQSIAEGAHYDVPGKFSLSLQAIKNFQARDTQMKSLKTNSTGMAYLSLKPGVWEEGDPHNQLVQLMADRYSGNDAHAKQERLLHCFFGGEEHLAHVQHNEELLEASRKAQAKLPALHQAFNAGLQPGESILLKSPFQTPSGGNEWMWVEVVNWKGNDIEGLLRNEPSEIPTLHDGQIVHVREGDVFDYIRRYPDERMEGNTTGVIIEKMSQENNSAATKQVASQQEIANCRPN
jgi:hypothetical protein